MSSRESVRMNEPAEDRALREELRQMLGAPAQDFFEIEPTPEIIALAERLRGEAQRRRHTQRSRPTWLLLAAGLPIALALAGLGTWGVQQKHRADALASTVDQKDKELQTLAAKAAPVTAQPSLELASNVVKAPKSLKNTKPGKQPGELIIPVEKGTLQPEAGTVQVKGH